MYIIFSKVLESYQSSKYWREQKLREDEVRRIEPSWCQLVAERLRSYENFLLIHMKEAMPKIEYRVHQGGQNLVNKYPRLPAGILEGLYFGIR